MNEIEVLYGKIITNIVRTNYHDSEDSLYFTLQSGEIYKMYHNQACCEHVTIEDICGDLDDLINSPVLEASERTNNKTDTENYESCTWTFYHISTIKGTVVIRWFGSSNGYYSEGVSFELQN